MGRAEDFYAVWLSGLHQGRKESADRIEALEADARRYRWLRDNPWSDELQSVIRAQRNVLWDAAIDAEITQRSE